MKRSKDKTVIVTGASRGIGKAIALAFGADGANVVVCARNEEPLRDVAAQIVGGGARSLPVVLDVRKEDDVRRCVGLAAETFGTIDVLVNNAGVSHPASVRETDLATWNLTVETNLTGTYLFSRAVLSYMLAQRRGLIINISSRSGQQGFPRYGAYCASKFGVMGFTFALAKEVGSQGVRVNVICPGEVDTDMNRQSHPGITDTSDWLQPEAVAMVVKFLASDEAEAVHGASIDVFGNSTKP